MKDIKWYTETDRWVLEEAGSSPEKIRERYQTGTERNQFII